MKSLTGNLVSRFLRDGTRTTWISSLEFSPSIATTAVSSGRDKKAYIPSKETSKKIREYSKKIMNEEKGVIPRPLTALQLFMKEHAGEKRSESEKDVGFLKSIKEKFDKLPDKKKETYQKTSEMARQRFNEQKEKEKENSTRPKSAYNYFIKERSANRPEDVPQKHYMATLAKEYHALSPKELAHYQNLAADDKARVEKVKAALPIVPKRLPTAFNLFVAERLAGSKDVKTSMKETGAAWKGMSEDEKQVYRDQAPTQPKPERTRGLTAYNFYLKQKGVKRLPDETRSEAMRRMGAEWTLLDVVKKQKFEDLAAADRLKFPPKEKATAKKPAASASIKSKAKPELKPKAA